MISAVVYFREIILESSRNVSETTPRTIVHVKGAGVFVRSAQGRKGRGT